MTQQKRSETPTAPPPKSNPYDGKDTKISHAVQMYQPQNYRELVDAALGQTFHLNKTITDKQGRGGTATLREIITEKCDDAAVVRVQGKVDRLLKKYDEDSPKIKAEKMGFLNANYFITKVWGEAGAPLSDIFVFDIDSKQNPKLRDKETFSEFIAQMYSIGAFAVKPSCKGNGAHVYFLSDAGGTLVTSGNSEALKSRIAAGGNYIKELTGYSIDRACNHPERGFYISGYRGEISADNAIRMGEDFFADWGDIWGAKATSTATIDRKGATNIAEKCEEALRSAESREGYELADVLGEDREKTGSWHNLLLAFAVSASARYVPAEEAREWAREKFEFIPDADTTERLFANMFTDMETSRTEQDNAKGIDRAKAEQERRDRLHRSTFRIRSTDTIKPPTPVLLTPDAKIGVSEGNIMTVTGAAKSKKTFYLQMVVAEYIAERGDLREGEILWFDTEQSASHAQKITHRIKALGDGELDEEGFQLYMLRELMPLDRAEVVEQTCKELKPRLLIIDGVVDLCASFLDLEHSTETVQLLMTLSSELQCAIVTVVHENKADRHARGHLGSLLMQKSETVAQLTAREKFPNYVEVDFPFTRNEKPSSFTFTIDDGLPRISGHALPAIPKGYELWEKCLTAPMQWADLRDAYARVKGIQPKTAEAHIKRATDAGLIAKGDGDMYTLIELQPSINPL
ncbi:MAG: AAA family ATPase [Rikenellaceae bacterium]